MKALQERIDAIREEFQEQRPDVVMVIDALTLLVDELEADKAILEMIVETEGK